MSLLLSLGHRANDCQAVKPVVRVTPEDSARVGENDIVELEGFSSKEENGKASKEIVTKLIEELESMTEKESLTGIKPLILDVAAEKSTDKEEWAYVGTSKGGQASPIKMAESCRSPNGFQVLQDLREEGEIDGEDEDIVEENMENVVLKGYIAKAVEVEEDGGADKDGFVVKDPPSVDASSVLG